MAEALWNRLVESPTVIGLLASCAGIFIVNRLLSSRKTYNHPLPPGPKRLPLIGNLLDLPPAGAHEWIHWAKHKELYGTSPPPYTSSNRSDSLFLLKRINEMQIGAISSVSVFGQNIVIINDLKYAIDLLDKQSAILSDRPTLVFGGQMYVETFLRVL